MTTDWIDEVAIRFWGDDPEARSQYRTLFIGLGGSMVDELLRSDALRSDVVITMLENRKLDPSWVAAACADPVVNSYIAANCHMDALLELAANELLTESVQLTLAEYDDKAIRVALARNPALTETAARAMLARTTHYRPHLANLLVRLTALHDDLSQDADHVVRSTVADSALIEPAVMDRMSFDPNPTVQEFLARNPAVRLLVNPAMSLRFLRRVAPEGIGLVEHHLEGCDPDARRSLMAGFTGSLREFREVVDALAHD